MTDDSVFDPFAGPAIEVAVPTTESQREIWTAARIGVDASLAFNESMSLRLHGALDLEALRAAIRDVVQRHESLRATFGADGMTCLIGGMDQVAVLRERDASGLPAAERTEVVADLQRHVVEEPFDLAHGPLVRFDMVRTAADEHTLMVTAHHIVCDGWSMGVVLQDLAALYAARRAGGSATLPPADRFSEYALSLLDAQEDARAADERYWLAQFSTLPPVLDLPTDRPRPPVKSYHALRADHALPTALVSQVRRASAAAGASLFGGMLGALAAFLHHLTGQDDFVVAVPAAGQAFSGRRTLVGHCVNTLSIRVAAAGADPAAAVLRRAGTAVLDGYEHQALSYGGLLRLLPMARDPGRLPLGSVCFNLERGLGAQELAFPDLSVEVSVNPRTYENFDLFLNAVEVDGAVQLQLQYNTDLFDDTTAMRWLRAYERVLESIAGGADRPISDLDVVAAEDLAQLAAWHGSARDLPEDALVHRSFEAQAARTPEAVAVQHDGEVLSYRELNERANQLARHLRSLDVGAGSMVGLCVERTPLMLVGLFGILKSGAAYVPLDPGYPADRLSYMAADARVDAIVVVEQTRSALDAPAARTLVSLDGAERPAIDALDRTNIDDRVGGDGARAMEPPAYVIYTSGSTGRPKGVLVSHRSAVNLLRSAAEIPGMTAEDVVLAITTLSFDIALSELVLPLVVGARIVLASREVAADGMRLRALVEETGVTFIDATPATYRLLVSADWGGGADILAICTGEAMPRDLAQELCARVRSVWNGYGPTETTVWSTFWQVKAPVVRVLIGRPVANTRAYVLDASRRPVLPGVRGELYIGGAGVALGYLGRPDLTAERFVADPFVERPDARMYRTGDLVRFTNDGLLEYLGRNDSQVKLRGFRIELGEIEAALLSHPEVREAAVTLREDRPGDLRLVGYTVTRGGDAPSEATLRAHLRLSLPDHMLPSTFVALDALPLTPSGKVDRRALPAPTQDARAVPDAFVAPRTPTEEQIAGLWGEVLGVPRISVHDDFFALGGHSLLASQILARLRRDTGIALPFRRIFEAPTVERFSELLDAERGGDVPGISEAPEIVRGRTGEPRPLSIQQERLWLLEELDPAQRAVHNLASAWRMEGQLDAAALEGALRGFVARHDAMRTLITVTDGRPAQLVLAQAGIALEIVGLEGTLPAQRLVMLDRFIRQRSTEPFDLAQAPLFRAWLLRFSPDDHVLVTLRHNIVWDGWSFDIFIRDLRALYEAALAGTSPTLPPLPFSYADYASWQRASAGGGALDGQVAWWRQHLADLPAPLELPSDRPRPVQRTYQGGRVSVGLELSEKEALTAMARAQGATLYMLLLAAFEVLLFRYTGRTEMLVGTPVRARTRPEFEDVVGPFVNTVMLRLRLESDLPFGDLLRRVRDVTLDAFGNQEVPLELLGGRPPAVRALFSLQDARLRPLTIGGLSLTQIHVPQETATNDVMLWAMERLHGLYLVLNYSADLFDEETSARFLQHYRQLLLSILRDPTLTVGMLGLLPAEELEVLLDGGASAPPHRSYAHTAPVRAPAAWADATGRALAITGDALARDTEGVVAQLRALQVGPGSRIALLFGARDREAAALLALLRLGATVVPLHPADPPAYARALLSQVGATLLVTDDVVSASPRAAEGVVVVLDDPTPSPTAEPVRPAPAGVPTGEIVFHEPAATGDGATTRVATHAGLVARVTDLAGQLGLTAADTVVACSGTARDARWLEILLAKAAGAALLLPEQPVVADGRALARLLGDASSLVVVAPDDVWRGLVATDWRIGSDVRGVLTGGPSSGAGMAWLTQRVGFVVSVSADPLLGGWFASSLLDGSGSQALIGRPLGPVRLFVRDERGQPAPLGVPGQLYCQQGMSHDEGAAASGDRARRLRDGAFELVRGDESRPWLDNGTRAPIEALERVLAAEADVARACATVHVDGPGRRRLVAYVATTTHGLADTALRRAARQHLPGSAVPDLVVEMSQVPGQADTRSRAQLPSPYTVAKRAYLPPQTESERLLAEAWRDALGVERVGLRDNFFDLGGYSLLLFRMLDTLAREHGVRVNTRALLLGTLEQAAAQMEQAGARNGTLAAKAEPLADGLLGRLKRLVTGTS